MIKNLCKLVVDNFGIDAVECVYPILLKQDVCLKLDSDTGRFIEMLKENDISYTIKELLNGNRVLELNK